MFKTFITISDMVIEEPALNEYLENGDIDLENILSKANEHMIQDLQNRNVKLAKICTPLTLVNNTAIEDKIERKRLVYQVNAIVSPCIATLQGCNTLSGTYTTIHTQTLTTIGEFNYFITDPYVYYKLILSNTTGLSINPYLIEISFDKPLLTYALSLAYKRLNIIAGDVYGIKGKEYYDDYKMLMDNLVYSYNEYLNEDVTINDVKTARVTFGR